MKNSVEQQIDNRLWTKRKKHYTRKDHKHISKGN
jgi:hypothetical protein